MKLRIQGDSLRLRLTQTEVRQLAESGAVESEMRVALDAAFRYALRASNLDRLAAEMHDHGLTVLVPRTWVEGWPDDDRVGFEGTHDAGHGRALAILIEKDFDCLHKRPDEDDLFPHPHADAR